MDSHQDSFAESFAPTPDDIFIWCSIPLLMALAWLKAIAPPIGLFLNPHCGVYVLLKSQMPWTEYRGLADSGNVSDGVV